MFSGDAAAIFRKIKPLGGREFDSDRSTRLRASFDDVENIPCDAHGVGVTP